MCIAFKWKYLSNHITILHMTRQLSCCAMCKIVAGLDRQNLNASKQNFYNI